MQSELVQTHASAEKQRNAQVSSRIKDLQRLDKFRELLSSCVYCFSGGYSDRHLIGNTDSIDALRKTLRSSAEGMS